MSSHLIASNEPIRLIVQADDFGMCHAVNLGIVRAFREGILTQAMAMPPCPWFPEAVELAHEHAIPTGLHCTLTSEWDHLRWRPLTDAPSLVEADGTFHRTVAAARAHARSDEATRELLAQAEQLVKVDLTPIYVDAHMGLVDERAYRAVSRRYDRPFLYPIFDPSLSLASVARISDIPCAEKSAWLMAYLAGLGPGTHFLQAHPALASRELRALVHPGSPIEAWAERHRVSDLDVLLAPAVRTLIEARGIELISADAAPIHGAASGSRYLFTME